LNWRWTAALFLVVVVLAAVAISIARQQSEDPATPPAVVADAPTTTRLLELDGTSVVRLQVTDLEAATSLVWEKESGERWFQVIPTRTQVVSSTLSASLSRLLSATSTTPLSPELNPASAYGLDSPSFEFVITAREGDTRVRRTLSVGNETPTGDSYFVSSRGDPRVFVVLRPGVDAVLNLLKEPPAAESTATR
jgi:hypothetical protein